LADGYFVMQQLSLHLLEEDLIEINSTQSLFANNRKCRKTTVQHQMAGCQRGLSLSKLATHGYNNIIITTHINEPL